MIRVPTALIAAVRQLSRLHRKGYTTALLQGLEELISQIDSKIEVAIAPESKSGLQVEERLEKLESHLADQSSGVETKLEAIAKHLEKLEQGISTINIANPDSRYNNTRPQKQVDSSHQPQVDLQPRTNVSLAQRLGVTSQSLITQRERQSAKEFTSWSRSRDPMNTGWEFSQKDNLYHPVK